MKTFDKIASVVPEIKGPSKPLTTHAKLIWAIPCVAVYIILLLLHPYGFSYMPLSSNPAISLLAPSYTLLYVGITPIIAVSLLAILVTSIKGTKARNRDSGDAALFQKKLVLGELIIAFMLSLIYAPGLLQNIPVQFASGYLIIFAELFASSIIVIYLNELLSKYSFTNGINIFLLINFVYVFGTVAITQLPSAAACIGSYAAISCEAMPYIPLIGAALLIAATYYVIKHFSKVNESAYALSEGIGARMPAYMLALSFFAFYLGSFIFFLLYALLLFFASLLHLIGMSNAAAFIALYSSMSSAPWGGIAYLIGPSFPLSYTTSFGGIGGIGPYFEFLATHVFQLRLPWGGIIMVPELVHVIVFALVSLAIALGVTSRLLKFSDKNEMGGQSDYKKKVMLQVIAIWALAMANMIVLSNAFGIVDVAMIAWFILNKPKGVKPAQA
jgi:hypothetical protein